MNQDQIMSLVRSLIKAGGGALAANGVNQHSTTQIACGILTAIIGWAWSHFITHADDPAPTTTSSKSGFALMELVFSIAILATIMVAVSCAILKPGADPLVVRAEQVEKSAQSSFDLILGIDSSSQQSRLFWMSNAPAFHNFCEQLREPTVMGTNIIPRCSAIIFSLDTVKQDYKSAKASSNDVFTAIATINSLVNQAIAWQMIVTNTANKPK